MRGSPRSACAASPGTGPAARASAPRLPAHDPGAARPRLRAAGGRLARAVDRNRCADDAVPADDAPAAAVARRRHHRRPSARLDLHQASLPRDGSERRGGHARVATTTVPRRAHRVGRREQPTSGALRHRARDGQHRPGRLQWPRGQPRRLPSLGGAGFQFTDPTFGSRMVRVTDAETRPDTVGRAWLSPSSAETTAWNTNSTRFYVVGGGGEQLPFDFDPTTMRASRIGKGKRSDGGLVLNFGGEAAFSFVDPDVLYGGDGSRLVSYRMSTRAQTSLHDVHSCLPGVATRGLNVSGTKDDRRLLVYVGGDAQDRDTIVYVYDRTLGCRWLNTQTGQVGGAWGPTGLYTGDKGLFLHNARISKGGRWARLITSNGRAGEYFWDIESLTLTPCPDRGAPNFCNGHQGMRFGVVINQRQLGDSMDFAVRPMNTPNSATPFPSLIKPLLTPAQWVVDTHLSWNNVQPDDKQPVCMEVYRPDNLVQRAWDGEIICVRTDGAASTVWRFAHHRSRVASFWDQPRANVSQDGRFVLFTSNWEQTVGAGRQDAFIVQLAPHR